MLSHPTLDKLQSLRLNGMYQALMEQMNMADIGELSFEERLGLLVDRELTDRDDRRLKTGCKRPSCAKRLVSKTSTIAIPVASTSR